MRYYTVLYYTILYYAIFYYTISYYTILYYTILYYTTLNILHSHLPHFNLICFISWIYFLNCDLICQIFTSIEYQLLDGGIDNINEDPALIRLKQKVKQLQWKLNISETSLKVKNICKCPTKYCYSRNNSI